MPIPIECPLCGHKGAVPDKFDNKQVKCPECCNLFFASPTGGPPPSSSKTGGSQAGTMKVSAAGGNQVRRPASPTMPGTQKLPTGGSQYGNVKISVPGGSQHGTLKKPGSHAGTQKSPAGGSAAGTMKSPGAGSAAGTAKAPVKPAAGSHQGMSKKPGSASGTAKKPPARPASRDPWSNLEYSDAPADNESVGRNYRKRRQRRLLTNLFVLFFLIGFLGIIGLGGAFTYSHIQGGGNIQDLFAKLVPKKSTEDKGATETAPEDDPGLPPVPKETKPEGPTLFDPSKGPARIGDVAIHLTGVTYAVPTGKDIEAKDKLLLVALKLENQGGKPVDFQGWGCLEVINEKHPPVAQDAEGQSFKRVTFGAGKLVDGQILAETIQPGKSIGDVVVFEPPPGGTPFVKVELSAENFGGKETDKFVLLISNTILTKGGLPKADPKIDPKIDPKGDPKPVELKELAVVAQYRALLKNPKQALPVKREAIAVLTELGPAAATAIPDLLPILQKDPDESIRLAAAECISKFGPRAKDAVPALIERVQKDDFWKVRAECANALSRIGPDAKDSLVALNDQVLKEKDEQALAAIKEAIKRLGGKP